MRQRMTLSVRVAKCLPRFGRSLVFMRSPCLVLSFSKLKQTSSILVVPCPDFSSYSFLRSS